MFRPMRRSRQQVSADACRAVLQTAKRGVLSVHGDDGYPYGVPLNFVFDAQTDTLYFHAAKEGHKLDAIRQNDKVCFTAWNDGYKQPGDWAWYVTSVVAFGRAHLVTDPQKSDRFLRALAEKYFPPEEDVEAELARHAARVQMIAVHIEHMTGKLVHEK